MEGFTFPRTATGRSKTTWADPVPIAFSYAEYW